METSSIHVELNQENNITFVNEFNLEFDNLKYLIKFGKSSNKEELIIYIKEENILNSEYYQNYYTLQQLQKINKYFRVFDNIDETIENFKDIISEKRLIIKKTNDVLYITFKINKIGKGEEEFNLEFKKSKLGTDKIVDNLISQINNINLEINNLKYENKNLKEEIKNIKEENIVKIDKDNRKEIIKQYDLSRIGNNIDEKIFYNKIFLDTEKNEYYKYIPYYNIPKYAPRKVYYEVMKENNKAPSTKDNNKKYKKIFKKYKDILLEKINNPDFNINNEKYDDDSKENIISIALNDFMKKLNKRQNWDNEEKEKINNEFKDLIDKLIKPLINKDTSINILKVINKSLSTEDNISKIFSYSNNNYYSHNSETIINLENAKKICDIIHDLIIIFNNNDEQKYIKELNKILNAIFELIRMSKTKNKYIGNNNENENEKKAIIFIYELLYKLLKTNEIFITYYFEKKNNNNAFR
jgi:hypothetical protein